MKLCFFISTLNPGGAERVASLLCNEWAKQHDVHLITLSSEPKPHFPLNPSIHLHSLNHTPNESLSIVQRLYRLGKRVKKLHQTLKELQPDVLISFMIESNIIASLASLPLKHKLVLSERTHPGYFRNPLLDHTLGRYSKWLRTDLSLVANKVLRKRFYSRADHVVVQTKHIADWFEKNTQLTCNVIENPIDLSLYSATPTPSNQTITCIGRMTFEKGHDLLIHAFISIAKQHPDWNLNLYGDGPLRPSLQKIAQQSPYSQQIHFLGSTKKIPEVLNTTDIFVLPSLIEGFPNILLEALSSGCSILSTHYPGFPEYLTPYLKLCLPDDIASMSTQLQELMNHSKLRETLKKSTPKATQHLNTPLIAHQWISIIQ
ncbi:MAG TPA: glycosyltransferase [Gammaproteobacteria bacterium]|nr:glycosyltransferase [Gammaproteobacteria bacterium]